MMPPLRFSLHLGRLRAFPGPHFQAVPVALWRGGIALDCRCYTGAMEQEASSRQRPIRSPERQAPTTGEGQAGAIVRELVIEPLIEGLKEAYREMVTPNAPRPKEADRPKEPVVIVIFKQPERPPSPPPAPLSPTEPSRRVGAQRRQG